MPNNTNAIMAIRNNKQQMISVHDRPLSMGPLKFLSKDFGLEVVFSEFEQGQQQLPMVGVVFECRYFFSYLFTVCELI